jgi:hypothetical protein
VPDHEPLTPCPLHGGEYSVGCDWCRLGKSAAVRSALHDWLSLFLRPREPGVVVRGFAILRTVGTALLLEADVGPTVTGPRYRRFLVRPDGRVLEIISRR